ncbi:DUF3717 domain-containing protein [Pusillimonas noertemannii]|uniref:DUF3717 domain-containing protein n=1 Tax=Pusillimonas noertemannii TaxID=305977 RepID=UPI00030F6B24|nr:DUF3717 domain-containing protein [Pusillimonas noertemannii]
MKRLYPLTELEAAINYWRNVSPSQGEEQALCAQAAALAEPYALMIYERRGEIEAEALSSKAQQALAEWEAATQR